MKAIPLTRGLVALVDDEDFAALNAFRWHAAFNCTTWYAERSVTEQTADGVKRRTLRMHRVILDPPDGLTVDHANADGLDNRRANLRVATQSQQNYNTGVRLAAVSPYKGVTPHGGRWRATIGVSGRQIFLGVFRTEQEAAQAYDAKAREVAGVFARLNDPTAACTLREGRQP